MNKYLIPWVKMIKPLLESGHSPLECCKVLKEEGALYAVAFRTFDECDYDWDIIEKILEESQLWTERQFIGNLASDIVELDNDIIYSSVEFDERFVPLSQRAPRHKPD